MKQLIIALMMALLISQPVMAIDPPQLVYLYSEVNEQNIYNTYLVDCAFDGNIVIDVRFAGGGTYATTIKCRWRITTPGEISIAWLESSGDVYGPLYPVGIDTPPTAINQTFLPLVAR